MFVLWVGQVRRACKNLTMIEEAVGGIEVRIFFFWLSDNEIFPNPPP